jgi:hypothetical protein
MFERKFIFQEGDASGWLLLYLAGTAMAALILTLRWFARKQAKSAGGSVGVVGLATEILAGLMFLGFGWQLWRMNLTGWLWFSFFMTIAAGVLIVLLMQYERKLGQPRYSSSLYADRRSRRYSQGAPAANSGTASSSLSLSTWVAPCACSNGKTAGSCQLS